MVTVFRPADPAAVFRATQRAKVCVNGVTIPASDISREVQQHPAETPEEAWRDAARALAIRELLRQEAQRLQIEAVPQQVGGLTETEDEARMRALIEQEVKTPEADEGTCRRYYHQNLQRFRSAEVLEVSHILLPAKPTQTEPLAVARQDAMVIIAHLARDPEAFASLAAAHSACSSGKAGGSLGQITKGETTPEFEAALARMETGETTREPVVSRYGVHIIRLHRRIEGDVLPFAAVHERIGDYLNERSRRQAIAQYLARLAVRAEMTGVDFPKPSDLRVH